ncbi:MAG: hypothetical protein AB7O68_17390 [Pirellulales bacterium]
MPRPGGEADKLGNRYEGVWTVGQILEVASDKLRSLTVEPIGDEARGIEFIATGANGTRYFHSVKRQRAGGDWSLRALIEVRGNAGRSILNDLATKLSADRLDECRFVSATGANDLRELCELAARSTDFRDFQNLLQSKRTKEAFEKVVSELGQVDKGAFAVLRRIRPILIDERTLREQVDHSIELLVYRPDRANAAPQSIRLLLADFVLEHLGIEIRKDAIWSFLAEHGYAQRNWAIDRTVHARVDAVNQAYARAVEVELVSGRRIPRPESQAIVKALVQQAGGRGVLLSAPAGVGKSCIVVQAVEAFQAHRIPVLVVRMDRHGDARSPDEIGRQMQLPNSPAVVLAGIANGGRSVLVVDQLDAVSQASGRYPHLWEAFDTLLREAFACEDMRVVVACRDFDLYHDSRLRQLTTEKGIERIQAAPFSVGDVDAILQGSNVDLALINPRQKELLRIPLNLMLFVGGANETERASRFQSTEDLFASYWERKRLAVAQRLDCTPSWTEVIDGLCEHMNQSLTLYAPDAILDEWADTVAAMCTEHVLVRDGDQIRFAHESLFDYVFARRFCSQRKSLSELLRSGEQHLFRRSQVRQILTFQRRFNRAAYLADLRHLLSGEGVRFHIRRLAIAWLGTLLDPADDEWAVIAPLFADDNLKGHLLIATRNSVAWGSLLVENGVISAWLSGSSEELINRGLWYLTFDQLRKLHSAQVAALLQPYVGIDSAWTKRLKGLFQFGNAYQSRAMQELFLKLVDNGAFDDGHERNMDTLWTSLRDAAEKEPTFVIEAICHWLDRRLVAAEPGTDVFAADSYDQSACYVIETAATKVPGEFVAHLLPRALAVIHKSQLAPRPARLIEDAIWRGRSNAEPQDAGDMILDQLVTGLRDLASDSPSDLDALVVTLEPSELDSVAFLLLKAWSANPAEYSDKVVRYLIDDPRRLLVGCLTVGSGDGRAAASRAAIQDCIARCSDSNRLALETAVIGFDFTEDTGRYVGWTERLLLEAFGDNHLSTQGIGRLHELRGKFPKQEVPLPEPRTEMASFVGSPIPAETTAKFTDDQWLDAMRDINWGWDDPLRDHGQGSAVELSRLLQPEAQKNRRRYAALALRMDDDTRPEYCEAILNGICSFDNSSKEARIADEAEFGRLPTQIILSVIQRLHQFPERPCGRAIGAAIECIADRDLTGFDCQMIAYYALEDTNPHDDDWFSRQPDGAQDPGERVHLHGYNSVRGGAARAIAALLAADFSRSDQLLPIVRKLVRDSSCSVRSCAIEALMPLLNEDSIEAVQLFLQACDGGEILFGSHPFESFLHYACVSHYPELRQILQKGLALPWPSARKVAARQICLAGLSNEGAADDAITVCRGTIEERCAAAGIYAFNVAHAKVGGFCRARLVEFFNDGEAEVRAKAGDCFQFVGEELGKYADLIRAYVESPALPSQHDDLIRCLGSTTWQLPDVTLELAQRFIASCGLDAGNVSTAAAGDAPTVAKLVIRLYSQSVDDTTRSRCLDLIDEMERLQFYGVEAELAEHDR